MARELWELQNLQALPLGLKVKKTQQRIREWVDHYGEDGVYVSFSGGKDSTVLLHIVREMYPNIKAMFLDTGLEYPEIRQFVNTFDNVDWVKPKMNYRQVIKKYGTPIISKEVAECVSGARTYKADLKRNAESGEKCEPRYPYYYRKLCGIGEYSEAKERKGKMAFSCKKYQFFLDAPFEIGCQCCRVMKKAPAKQYTKNTGRVPMTAMMASESRLRIQKWLKQGCNAFDAKKPMSMPMAFWTEQDVMQYIYENRIQIASIYGSVVKDDCYKQMSFLDIENNNCKYKTTGVIRTGCVFCLFGIHLEGNPNRLEMLKESHPALYAYVMRPESDGGLGYKEKIDWINEHGNMNIKY